MPIQKAFDKPSVAQFLAHARIITYVQHLEADTEIYTEPCLRALYEEAGN